MSDALVATVVDDATAAALPAPGPRVVYQPRTKDFELLAAYQDVLEESGRISHQAIAGKIGVSREAVRKRLAVTPGLREWLNDEIRQAVEDAWPKVLARATALALRGSVHHMRFLAEVGGKMPTAAAPGVAGGRAVNIHIHV